MPFDKLVNEDMPDTREELRRYEIFINRKCKKNQKKRKQYQEKFINLKKEIINKGQYLINYVYKYFHLH